MDETLRIGISACLLGHAVRYDGAHKRAPAVLEAIADVEWVPVCPEVEIGMGTPREPIRLVERTDGVRLVGVDSGVDHTDRMRSFAARRVAQLEALGISGFVLKARSPSCACGDAPIHDPDGRSRRDGNGLFAAELMGRVSDLPVDDETHLHDPEAVRRFVARANAYRARHDRRTSHTS